MDANTYPYRMARPFFSDLPAYVHAYQDEAGETYIPTEKTDCGRAILCFPSLVDAFIETVQLGQIGLQSQILHAQQVQPSAFRDADGCGLIALIHLGWPAIDGKLMLRPGGGLAGYGKVMHHRLQGSLTFELDPIVLAEITRLHEAAGLFAWRETLEYARECDPGHLSHLAAHALESIELSHGNASQVQQIALFDPEAGQWHLVPRPSD